MVSHQPAVVGAGHILSLTPAAVAEGIGAAILVAILMVLVWVILLGWGPVPPEGHDPHDIS